MAKKKGGKKKKSKKRKKKSEKDMKSKNKKENESKEKSKKSEIEEHNKILKNLLIGVGTVVLILFIGYLLVQSAQSFEHRGVSFKVERFCDSGPCLVTYHTKVPIVYKGKDTKYNFYLRNDPRKLDKDVPFEGDLNLNKNMYLDVSYNQFCEGFSQIAMQNFKQLHRDVVGMNLLNGKNETCQSSIDKDSTYLLLQEANETSIKQETQGCYTINIKDCEILEGTERFMVETFVELGENDLL